MSLRFTFTPIAEEHMIRRGVTVREILGAIPDWLSPDDPAGAVEQIDAAYRVIGGGWRDSKGSVLSLADYTLTYPGDAPRRLIARTTLRDERILFFDGAWIAVVQLDGAYRVARID